MNVTSIFDLGIKATSEHARQCKKVLAELRQRRCRAEECLLQMCCNLQRNPRSLDPEKMSCVVAEVRYLEGATKELEHLLNLNRKIESTMDQDV